MLIGDKHWMGQINLQSWVVITEVLRFKEERFNF